MPKGHPLTEEQRERIYDLHTMNVHHEDIADQFGISVGTVDKCVSRQRKLHQERKEHKVAEIVVAGDKKNGRLVSVGSNQYDGTCLVKGKMKRRTFMASNARGATEQWEKWCQDLRDEQQFMDMVERKEPEPKPEPPEEITPIIEVKPWKDVAEERQQRITELEARIAELEQKQVSTGSIDYDKPVYVLWAKSDKPKLYGVYQTMESALKELDKLNDVARFLGSGDAFEVEEVAWK